MHRLVSVSVVDFTYGTVLMVMNMYGGPPSIRRILLLVNMHYIISDGADIHASIRIPPETNSINLKIVAQTATEGDTKYKVRVLMIENIG